VICSRCKHRVGVTIHGRVVCEKYGEVTPRIICRGYESEEPTWVEVFKRCAGNG